MIFCRLHCDQHPHEMCVDHSVTRDGLVINWAQEKCFSSDSLSLKLYKAPFLLTLDTLPQLLIRIAGHKNKKEILTQIMALGYLLRNFPLPVWLYDMPRVI